MPRLNPVLSLSAIAMMAAVLSQSAMSAAPTGPAKSPQVEYLTTPGSKMPFSPAVRVGDMLYLSGQIGAQPDGTLPADFSAQARQAMANLSEVLLKAGSSFDDVVKCTVMLTDMSHWQDFNRIYVGYFKPGRLPARSAIGANALALGAQLEVECLAFSPAHAAPAPP
jgi:2-iminobutanoate/2-iminopropanoate deaminase